MKYNYILDTIKSTLKATQPDAKLILYGSYARGDFNENSDIDLLILLKNDSLKRSDVKKVTYPLYDIEIETGTIISPIVFSEKEWETKHYVTPFYENIKREGRIL